jgi:hypothetical protein
MRRIKHWQDPVSVLVGIWLIASPWTLGLQGPLQAVGDFVVIGAVLLALALGALFVPEAWEEWSELVLGLWLIASPWILEFTEVQAAVQNAVVCGGLVTALALWVLGTDDEYGGWFHRLTH